MNLPRPTHRPAVAGVLGPGRRFTSPLPDCAWGAHAFTLVELLVAMAVIGILAALLLTTLGRGRQSAQRVQCVGNLRQLGLATQMYWDENGGRAFRYRGAATNGGDFYWFGWLAQGAEGQRAFDPAAGALYPYLGGRGVDLCPALNYSLARFKLKATGATYGYGYNLQLSSPDTQPPVNVHNLTRLSGLAVLADAAQVNTFQPPASPDHPLLEEFYYLSTNEPTVHFRHRRRANVAFGDGHVAAEQPVPDSLDTRLAGETIGRLRTENLVLP